MTNRVSSMPYEDQPCERCGSPKRISKKWTEILTTFHSTSKLEHMKIVCTNSVCQEAFEENLKKDAEKRDVVRLAKEEKDKLRKANSLLKSAARAKN
ncbi:hypothetical protein HY030_03960 [Candidatus Gottesmanbacteria bacterium]|nr:hypothetical protein [Candidatus Gottesmanbacteria bacterium]